MQSDAKPSVLQVSAMHETAYQQSDACQRYWELERSRELQEAEVGGLLGFDTVDHECRLRIRHAGAVQPTSFQASIAAVRVPLVQQGLHSSTPWRTDMRSSPTAGPKVSHINSEDAVDPCCTSLKHYVRTKC